MMLKHPARAGSRAYTLIELVLVITIAGVLAAAIGPHFFDTSVFAQRGYADELAGALRFAQKAAVASDCPARVTVTAGSYSVSQQAPSGNSCDPNDGSWSTAVVGFDGSAVQDNAPNGVTASPLGTWVFNGSGALAAAPANTITVGAHAIAIDSATGFVQVQ